MTTRFLWSAHINHQEATSPNVATYNMMSACKTTIIIVIHINNFDVIFFRENTLLMSPISFLLHGFIVF